MRTNAEIIFQPVALAVIDQVDARIYMSTDQPAIALRGIHPAARIAADVIRRSASGGIEGLPARSSDFWASFGDAASTA